jgi:hypothetical protein
VHGDLKRHRSRCFARRAHGASFGQVEHGEPGRRQAIGAGIEQARRSDPGLGPAAGQVAGPVLVSDGGDLAVPGRTDPDALDRRGPVLCVVEREWPRQRDLDGPSGGAGSTACRALHHSMSGKRAGPILIPTRLIRLGISFRRGAATPPLLSRCCRGVVFRARPRGFTARSRR